VWRPADGGVDGGDVFPRDGVAAVGAQCAIHCDLHFALGKALLAQRPSFVDLEVLRRDQLVLFRPHIGPAVGGKVPPPDLTIRLSRRRLGHDRKRFIDVANIGASGIDAMRLEPVVASGS